MEGEEIGGGPLSQPEHVLNPQECVSEGWKHFKQNKAVAILGCAIYLWLSVCVSGLPAFAWIFYDLIIDPAMQGGLAILSLNLARNQSPRILQIFKGFERYWSFLGATWLLYGVFALCLLPIGFGLIIDSAIDVYTILFSILSIALIAHFFLRWFMVTYLIADGFSVIEAFRKSARMTRGYRARLLMLFLLSLLLALAGFMLFFLGSLVTFPVSAIACAVAYARLADSQSSQVEELDCRTDTLEDSPHLGRL